MSELLGHRLTFGVLLVVVGLGLGLGLSAQAAAVFGVVGVMLGFQLLTVRATGVRYVLAAAFTTAALLLIARHHRLTWGELGLGKGTLLTGAAWSLILLLLIAGVMALATRVRALHTLFADERVINSTGGVAARRALFDIPFGTVLVEEFAFRGVMYALLAQTLNSSTVVLITALLFGLWHVGPALDLHRAHTRIEGSRRRTIGGVVLFTAVAGVAFGLLRLWTGSLLPPAAAHWSANASAVIAGWLVGRHGPKIEIDKPR